MNPKRLGSLIAPFLLTLFTAAVAAQSVKETTFAALLEHGKRDLDRSYYQEAETALRKAVMLNPNSARAHELLARALLGQVPLNLHLFPDTEQLLPKAEDEAKKTVALDPSASSSWCILGMVEHKLAEAAPEPRQTAERLNNADFAFRRAIEVNPQSFEAHYEFGKMTVDMAGIQLLAARIPSGAAARQPGPIIDPAIRRTMQMRYGKSLEDALLQMQEALRIDPKSGLAMHQMSGLFLERALLRDTDQDYQADVRAAAEWAQKSDVQAQFTPAK